MYVRFGAKYAEAVFGPPPSALVTLVLSGGKTGSEKAPEAVVAKVPG